jgi:hypothetical protein
MTKSKPPDETEEPWFTLPDMQMLATETVLRQAELIAQELVQGV